VTHVIVVGVDGSDSAKRAVEWCARYGAALDATVVAVHALEIPVPASPTLGYVPTPPIADEAQEELRELMRTDWCAALDRAGVPFHAVIVEGSPVPSIIEVAQAENADLVVTGRRGRGGFAELILGSTSHSLTHHLDRPLVIVP
jgi:nucleotide-binding universal stress UspA family protein